MSTTDPSVVPSTPNPTMQTLIYTLLRAILTIMGAVGIGVGANLNNNGTLMVISGALATIVGLAWSLWEKFSAARAAHNSAVASAAARTPVKA